MVKIYGKAFDALGDPTRRTIFEKLGKGAQSVVKLAAGIPVSRPAVSQHLYVLKDAGLISVRREGTRNIYQIDEVGVLAMRNYLDQFWESALTRFKLAAEEAQKQKSKTKK